MKTLEELKNQEPVFLNDWKDSKIFGYVNDWEGLYLSESEYNEKPKWVDDKNWEKKKIEFDEAKLKHSDYHIVLASYSLSRLFR